jgi:hypothetical protein
MRNTDLQEWLDSELGLDCAEPEDEMVALTIDGCDSAIIGVYRERVVYSRSRLEFCFILQGMTEEEAGEWVDFNIVGAYVGPGTPIVVEDRNLPKVGPLETDP